jgi:prepilin-type N-terminal cleavage/methylation domain-containing protein
MQNRGFTLIEVLVAGALASVVLVGTFLLFQGGINQATTLNRNQEFDMVELGIRSCLLSSPLQSYRGSTGAVWYSTQ